MSTERNTISVREYRYELCADLTSFNHLCTFVELSNVHFRKGVHTEDGLVYVSEDYTSTDYEVFYLLLSKACHPARGKKGLLYTAVTGSKSRWSGYVDKWKIMKPLIERLTVNSSMVLYEDPECGNELTMFNIAVPTEDSNIFDDVRDYILKQNTQDVPDAKCHDLRSEDVHVFLGVS